MTVEQIFKKLETMRYEALGCDDTDVYSMIWEFQDDLVKFLETEEIIEKGEILV